MDISDTSGSFDRRNGGFVLAIVLVLLVLATGPAYMALAYAHVSLAQGNRQHIAALMRIEASDAMWAELKQLTRLTVTTNSIYGVASTLKTNPAGYQTRTIVRKLNGREVPDFINRSAQPVAGSSIYIVSANVTSTDRQTTLQSYVARGTNSVVRILAWIEP